MRAIVISNHHTALGGAYAAARMHADILNNAGIETHIETLDSYKMEKPNHPSQYIYNRKFIEKLNRRIRLLKPDIAFIHNFVGGVSSGVVLALKEHCIPIVHVVHDYRAICPNNSCLDGKLEICTSCVENSVSVLTKRCSHGSLIKSGMVYAESLYRKYKKLYELIDHYIFVSEFSRDLITKSLNIDRSKTSVFYNSVNDIGYAGCQNEENIEFLIASRISREKGIFEFANTLYQTYPKRKLTVVGDGPDMDRLVQLPNVITKGKLPNQEVLQLLKCSKFFVMPSRWYENNPLSVIEALSVGTPVIAAKIGGLTEMISPGKNGFLFEPFSNEDLSNTLTEAAELVEAEYELMCENARKTYLATNTVEILSDNLVGLAKEIISRNK